MARGSVLRVGEVLRSGDYMQSPSERFILRLRKSGWLEWFTYMNGEYKILWWPGQNSSIRPGSNLSIRSGKTSNPHTCDTMMLQAGNDIPWLSNFTFQWSTTRILYSFKKEAKLCTQTDSPRLHLQDDGNLVLYSEDGRAVWASNTDIGLSKATQYDVPNIYTVNVGGGTFSPVIDKLIVNELDEQLVAKEGKNTVTVKAGQQVNVNAQASQLAIDVDIVLADLNKDLGDATKVKVLEDVKVRRDKNLIRIQKDPKEGSLLGTSKKNIKLKIE